MVTKALEDARTAGTLTKSQEARVVATVPAEAYELLCGDMGCDLAEFFIVSDVALTPGEEYTATIEPAEGERLRSLLELPRFHRCSRRACAHL